MKIDVTEKGEIQLSEVFLGVLLKTQEGNAIGLCMRDDTLEMNVMPDGEDSSNWWRVNMQTGQIAKTREDAADIPQDIKKYLIHLEKMVADIDPLEYPEGQEKSTIARLHKVYYPDNY